MKETYYSVDKIAEILGIHPKTVRRYIIEGKLRAVKVGKQYRINGHDLSVFVEGRGMCSPDDAQEENSVVKLNVSAVADITVRDREEADRISSLLIAVMNTQDPLFHQSSLNVQQYETSRQLRVMLWGNPRFVIQMLECIEVLSGCPDKEDI